MTYDNKSYRVVAPATQSLHMRDTRFQGLVKILKLMFRQDFEAEVWSLFCATDAWFWL